MNYIKLTPYLYFVVALFFIYDGVTKWNDAEERPELSLLIAGLCVFMFFFRLKFAAKFDKRNKKE